MRIRFRWRISTPSESDLADEYGVADDQKQSAMQHSDRLAKRDWLKMVVGRGGLRQRRYSYVVLTSQEACG